MKLVLVFLAAALLFVLVSLIALMVFLIQRADDPVKVYEKPSYGWASQYQVQDVIEALEEAGFEDVNEENPQDKPPKGLAPKASIGNFEQEDIKGGQVGVYVMESPKKAAEFEKFYEKETRFNPLSWFFIDTYRVCNLFMFSAQGEYGYSSEDNTENKKNSDSYDKKVETAKQELEKTCYEKR